MGRSWPDLRIGHIILKWPTQIKSFICLGHINDHLQFHNMEIRCVILYIIPNHEHFSLIILYSQTWMDVLSTLTHKQFSQFEVAFHNLINNRIDIRKYY